MSTQPNDELVFWNEVEWPEDAAEIEVRALKWPYVVPIALVVMLLVMSLFYS